MSIDREEKLNRIEAYQRKFPHHSWRDMRKAYPELSIGPRDYGTVKRRITGDPAPPTKKKRKAVEKDAFETWAIPKDGTMDAFLEQVAELRKKADLLDRVKELVWKQ